MRENILHTIRATKLFDCIHKAVMKICRPPQPRLWVSCHRHHNSIVTFSSSTLHHSPPKLHLFTFKASATLVFFSTQKKQIRTIPTWSFCFIPLCQTAPSFYPKSGKEEKGSSYVVHNKIYHLPSATSHGVFANGRRFSNSPTHSDSDCQQS